MRTSEPTFFLGTCQVDWLRREDAPGPLFVSVRRLRQKKRWRPAVIDWAMDSGGFTELDKFGRWETPVDVYAAEILRADREIGRLRWAAPQDWMCEPSMLAKTGLSVEEHQDRTVSNFVELRSLVGDLVIPVLQGWTLDDYRRCIDKYSEAGVDLTSFETVGVGSVCRRDVDDEIVRVLDTLASWIGPRLHGFGVRSAAFAEAFESLSSADSMAWSYNARKNPPIPGHSHKSCSNCIEWARRWRNSRPEPPDEKQLRFRF